MSMAFERMQQFNSSVECAFKAIECIPYHPEPYWRLATVRGLLAGDVRACEFFTNMAGGLPDPPFFAFRNPLDRSFNSHLSLGNAYANNGQITRARMEFEKAAATVPSDTVVKAVDEFKQKEFDARDADAWSRVLATCNGDVPKAPDNIWQFSRIRDIVVPKMLASRPNTQPRIIFYCGRSVEPWAPPVLNTTGIGGSETAVIKIADKFSRDGWRVDIYNEPDKYEGEYDGAGYWGCNRLHASESAEVFVSWRNPQAGSAPIQRKLSLLWCHDLNQGPSAADDFHRWDMVLGVSKWHASYLSQVYGVRADVVAHVPNGIDLDRFDISHSRVPFRCVYTSSPDRGLERLLAVWPEIVKNEPTAELHVAYGWDTIDKYIAMGHSDLIQTKQRIQDTIKHTPNVVWVGRLPQDKLAKLFCSSYLWLYPADFLEVSCITAMESMASGCIPVVSSSGALPETIAAGGLIVPGNVYTRSWREYYSYVVKGALHSIDTRRVYSKAGVERSKELTWDISYSDYWRPLVTSMLEKNQNPQQNSQQNNPEMAVAADMLV
jgi:glycosyltransferase involved in cell wall biosynthesis